MNPVVFTAGELELLDAVADGMTNPELAARFAQSEDWVTRETGRMGDAAGFATRAGLVGYGYRTGQLEVHPGPRSETYIGPPLRRVAELIPLGLGNQAIADKLGLQLSTVHGYAKDLLGHLEARNRAHAVRRSLDTGLIKLGRHLAPVPLEHRTPDPTLLVSGRP